MKIDADENEKNDSSTDTIISPPKILGGTRTIRLESVELTTQVLTPGIPGIPGMPFKEKANNILFKKELKRKNSKSNKKMR